MLQEWPHRFESDQDLAPDLLRGTHRIHGDQDPAVAVPRDDGSRHLVVESQALGNDLWSVVGAMLKRGPREQSARELRVVCLQVQRHIRGHPERSEEHTSELQSRSDLVCRLLLEKKKKTQK